MRTSEDRREINRGRRVLNSNHLVRFYQIKITKQKSFFYSLLSSRWSSFNAKRISSLITVHPPNKSLTPLSPNIFLIQNINKMKSSWNIPLTVEEFVCFEIIGITVKRKHSAVLVFGFFLHECEQKIAKSF